MKTIRPAVKSIALGVVLVAFASCADKYLPESLDAFDPESGFTQIVFKPQLGRTTLMTSTFKPGNSTLPFEFEITNVMRADGSPAPELTDYFPVKVWETPYLGTETSLAEIESKRKTEYRRLFDVRKHSGEFIMWEKANSGFVLCAPDSCYVFDVLTSNSGGYKYTTRMRLIPTREVEFEPSNVDPLTGLSTVEYVHPTSVSLMQYNNSDYGGRYSFYLSPEDVQVFFRKIEDNPDPEKTLTFRFYKNDYTPIDPAEFTNTNWEMLIHGFDMEKTTQYVRYKTAYPIPLVATPSKYTNTKGDLAKAVFSYDYFAYSGRRWTGSMTLEFAIHTEAHWEIIFVFASGDPVFGN